MCRDVCFATSCKWYPQVTTVSFVASNLSLADVFQRLLDRLLLLLNIHATFVDLFQ